MNKTGGKCFFNLYLFTWLHVAEQHVRSRWKWTTCWSTAAHVMIDLRSCRRIDPRPTRFLSGKANECWWRLRRYQVDPWSRRQKVPRGVVHFSLKQGKGSTFSYRREIDNLCRLFSPNRPWTRVFVSDAWPAPVLVSDAWPTPDTFYRPCCEHCDQRMGPSP